MVSPKANQTSDGASAPRACNLSANWDPVSHALWSFGSGRSATWPADSLIRPAVRAAPTERRAAWAAVTGALRAAARCHRSSTSGSTTISGVSGTRSPTGSTTTSRTAVWVATRSLGRRRRSSQAATSGERSATIARSTTGARHRRPSNRHGVVAQRHRSGSTADVVTSGGRSSSDPVCSWTDPTNP